MTLKISSLGVVSHVARQSHTFSGTSALAFAQRVLLL